MAKSPKNRRTRRPRSRSPQVNVGAQRTPTNPVQNAGRVVADTVSTVSTGVRRIFDSGLKVMRRNKNRDSNATGQQDNASTMTQQDVTSMMVNTPSISTLDGGNLGNNTTQEHGVMDPDALFLSELGARTPQFGTNTTNEFSPICSQDLSLTQSFDPSENNLGSPPRLNSSGNNNVTVTGMDLLDTQNVTASSNSVVGTHIPAPSPRRSTQ